MCKGEAGESVILSIHTIMSRREETAQTTSFFLGCSFEVLGHKMLSQEMRNLLFVMLNFLSYLVEEECFCHSGRLCDIEQPTCQVKFPVMPTDGLRNFLLLLPRWEEIKNLIFQSRVMPLGSVKQEYRKGDRMGRIALLVLNPDLLIS